MCFFFFFFFGKQGNIINYKTLVAAPVLQSLERQRPITSSTSNCKTTEGGKTKTAANSAEAEPTLAKTSAQKFASLKQ